MVRMPYSLLYTYVCLLVFLYSQPVNHGNSYKLTEEFTSVYRLHPMLPDSVSGWVLGYVLGATLWVF